jgi:hypothetical protein
MPHSINCSGFCATVRVRGLCHRRSRRMAAASRRFALSRYKSIAGIGAAPFHAPSGHWSTTCRSSRVVSRVAPRRSPWISPQIPPPARLPQHSFETASSSFLSFRAMPATQVIRRRHAGMIEWREPGALVRSPAQTGGMRFADAVEELLLPVLRPNEFANDGSTFRPAIGSETGNRKRLRSQSRRTGGHATCNDQQPASHPRSPFISWRRFEKFSSNAPRRGKK